MADVYFSADFHLGHHNIMKYCNRPFTSVEEMNQTIIDNVNAVVGRNDVLYFIGDFCFQPAKNAKLFREQINCYNIVLIKGNHDGGIPHHIFSSTHDLLKLTISQKPIILCHYALRTWQASHYNSWHLYAHSHGNLDEFGLSFDIGVDCHDFKPWSQEEIFAKMLYKEKQLCEKC